MPRLLISSYFLLMKQEAVFWKTAPCVVLLFTVLFAPAQQLDPFVSQHYEQGCDQGVVQ